MRGFRGALGEVARTGVAWWLALAALLPLWLVVKQAITPDRESFAWPPTLVPHAPTLENLAALGSSRELSSGLVLSALVAIATVVTTLAIALPAAWLAAREPESGRRLDAAVVLARVFPAIAVAVPLAVVFVRLGFYNSPVGSGLVLAHTLLGLPIAFLVLRAGFRGVPRDLEEAARLDGATPLAAFVRVTLPLVRPQLATAALLVFLASWDELTYALLLQVTNRTLPPLLYYLSAFGFPGTSSAVAMVMLLPALALVAVLSRAFRTGLLSGSGR